MTNIAVNVTGVADRAYFDPRLGTWGAVTLAPYRGRVRPQGRGYRVEYSIPEDIAVDVLEDLRDVADSFAYDPSSRAEERALRKVIDRIDGVLRFLSRAPSQASGGSNVKVYRDYGSEPEEFDDEARVRFPQISPIVRLSSDHDGILVRPRNDDSYIEVRVAKGGGIEIRSGGEQLLIEPAVANSIIVRLKDEPLKPGETMF